MKQLVTSLIFILCTLSVSAQRSDQLTCIVQNEEGEPIGYAEVHIHNMDRILRCNHDGVFTLSTSVGERTEVIISATGYKTKSFIVNRKSRARQIFVLERTNLAIDEVIVHGSSEKAVRMSSSQNLVVIDQSYVENNFAGSLMQSLEGVPGVKAMSIGSGQSKPAIRGLGFNRMIVAENGVKHEGQQWGEDHGLEIDQFSIDDIEIIKGPGSLLYGSDAIGGVIRLSNSYVPDKPFEGRLNVFARSNNESIGMAARVAGKSNRFYYKANVTLIDYGDYKVPTDSIQYYSYYIKLKDRRLRNTAGKEINGGVTLGYIADNFKSDFQLSNVYSKAGFFSDAHGLEVRLSDIDYDKSSRDIDVPNHSVNHIKIANNTVWQLNGVRLVGNFAFQNNLRKEYAEAVSHGYMPIPPNTLERKFDKNTYTGNIGAEFTIIHNHNMNAGISAEHQRNRRGGWGFVIPDFETTSAGAYLFDRFHILDDLILSAGVRFDRVRTHIHSYRDWYETPVDSGGTEYLERSTDLKRTFNSFSWSVGINYDMDLWNFKANIGKSFRAPIAKELGSDGVNYHIFRYEKGDQGLSAEESYQIDLGVSWHNRFLGIHVDPYLNYFPNYIYMNPTSKYHEGLQAYYYTQSKVIRYGFEAEISAKFLRNFDASVKGEYLYAEQLSGEKKGYTLPFSPPWSSNVSLRYMPRTRWSGEDGFISATLNIVGDQKQIVPPESKTKGHTSLDMSLGRSFKWKVCKLKVSFQAQNLLDKKYYDHTSYYRLIDVPEPGRNFSIMIGFDF